MDWQNYVTESQNSLRVIAELTGGYAAVNQNDFDKALKRIDAETSDYYVVGYYSSNPDPTKKRRRIDVKVTRASLNVIHRTEYTLEGAAGRQGTEIAAGTARSSRRAEVLTGARASARAPRLQPNNRQVHPSARSHVCGRSCALSRIKKWSGGCRRSAPGSRGDELAVNAPVYRTTATTLGRSLPPHRNGSAPGCGCGDGRDDRRWCPSLRCR